MAFDVFALREKVVQEYGDYFRSFVNIADDRISAWAEERLNEHTYWPDPVLQLNPAFEQGSTLASLANEGIIHRSTAAFFGPDMRLHRHQEEALHKAREQKPYLVTTGTGSGKSLTYLLPIVDAILRNRPEVESTRAIIIYPMNALINSQLEALERYRRNDPGTRLTFQRYTGQDIGKERENILAHPPHILLTNFVMADYLMMRPAERAFFQALLGGESDLQFIVLDEMHVHRGRQGADVAMTVRRLRQRARADVQLICTSATIVTEGGRQDRRIATAAVGSTLLGVLIEPDSVIDETLTATSFARLPEGQAEVAASVLAPAPLANELAVRNHPLAAWVEQTFGIDQDDNGRLVRRRPITLKAGLDKLVAASGLERSICDKALKDILEAGYAANREHPVFAFRLHQFLSSGSSVYSTLEPAAHRQLTLAGQRFLEAQSDTGGRRMLVPMAFCRECGQEHLLVTLVRIEGNLHAIPRSALNTWQSASADDEGDEMDASVRTGAGYLVFETTGDADRLHSGEIDDLPEAWLEVMKRTGVRIKKNYQRHRPQELWVSPDGTVYRQPQPGLPRAWFQPTPIRVCLHCRESWSAAQRSDFGKLSTFSQTGRSTATTLVTTSAIQHLRNMQPGSSANKVLSFTDNRQDAALQAGHMNDFVQVAMVRSALATVVHQQGASLSYHDLGHAIASALNLPAVNLLRDTTPDGSIPEAAREAFEDLLTFRAIEDLRRAWRVNMPNLEEAGLLRIGYAGLDEIADSDARWQGVPFMNALDGPARFTILTALLNHFRSLLAIDYPGLTREGSKRLIRRVQEELRDPWTIDEFDRLRQGQIVRMPGVPEPPARLRLLTVGSGSQSTIGKYLRDKRTWNRFDPLTVPDLEAVFTGIVDALTGTLLTRDTKTQGLDGVQLKTSVLRWEPGSDERPAFDVVRTRGAHE
ncbi:MAG TPA: DEAD/DEAH box helicase, partial [Thermomicrobiales bacterium]|nr:DEAD/DEAH box helicase [Thermomicrobiales bacterium]